jgi:2-oxoglutarate dehydrogenase E2 component (dihydrolipoamide succinyltransferase)
MIDIRVPPLGESITEATVARWAKNEGDAVAAGETIVELETDKINVEVPAERAGVLAKRARAEGDVVGVGDVLGQLDESAAVPAAAGARSEGARSAGASAGGKKASSSQPSGQERAPTRAAGAAAGATAAPPRASAAAASAAAASAPPPPAPPRVAPGAARLAEEQGISLAGVKGTGRGGVVSRPDVFEQVVDAKGAESDAPASQAPRAGAPPMAFAAGEAGRDGSRETREKMSTRRKRIAENLLHSQQSTAHLTTFNEIDMSAVMQLRERHKERVEKAHGVKLSFMPFFARASVLALEAYPVVNAQVDGDTIVYRHYVNLGIAVASEQGLVVPNVKDAHAKGLLDIGRDIAELARRARDTKLTMDDLTGGTFTITNGGVFGSLVSTPIINYPQVAILGLHKIQERAVVIEGRIEARPMMYVALSYDHRIIDGQQAVLFLVRVKELMEDPAAMLIG